MMSVTMLTTLATRVVTAAATPSRKSLRLDSQRACFRRGLSACFRPRRRRFEGLRCMPFENTTGQGRPLTRRPPAASGSPGPRSARELPGWPGVGDTARTSHRSRRGRRGSAGTARAGRVRKSRHPVAVDLPEFGPSGLRRPVRPAQLAGDVPDLLGRRHADQPSVLFGCPRWGRCPLPHPRRWRLRPRRWRLRRPRFRQPVRRGACELRSVRGAAPAAPAQPRVFRLRFRGPGPTAPTPGVRSDRLSRGRPLRGRYGHFGVSTDCTTTRA